MTRPAKKSKILFSGQEKWEALASSRRRLDIWHSRTAEDAGRSCAPRHDRSRMVRFAHGMSLIAMAYGGVEM